MPRFDYTCPSCGKPVSDVWVRTSDELVACPCCGCDMDKQPAAPNFKLVGKGFHVNDYPKGRR